MVDSEIQVDEKELLDDGSSEILGMNFASAIPETKAQKLLEHLKKFNVDKLI